MGAKQAYSQQDVEILKQTSMVAILADFGCSTRQFGKNMYISPFREETKGSFHINDYNHVWHDFGTGEGGTVITLVQRLLERENRLDADSGRAYRQALDYLASLNPTITPVTHEEMERRREENTPSSLSIVGFGLPNDSAGFHRFLLDYASGERRIPAELLSRYCRDVAAKTEKMTRPFHWVGFPNSYGGWAMRNNMESRMKKGAVSPAAPTFFTPDGRIMLDTESNTPAVDRISEVFSDSFVEGVAPRSNKVVVFEGFFDFLSWMAWNQIDEPGMDVAVLNSTSFLQAAEPFLLKHDRICTMMDADKTGREKTAELLVAVEGENDMYGRAIQLIDASQALDEGKDLAQMYVEACQKMELEIEGANIRFK